MQSQRIIHQHHWALPMCVANTPTRGRRSKHAWPSDHATAAAATASAHFNQHAPTASTGQQQRRRIRTCAAQACVLFDLDSVVDMEGVLTACAWQAAKQQWPHAVVGHAAAYVPTMGQLLTSIEAPEEAALLIRLLADEGIIGTHLSLLCHGGAAGGWGDVSRIEQCRAVLASGLACVWINSSLNL